MRRRNKRINRGRRENKKEKKRKRIRKIIIIREQMRQERRRREGDIRKHTEGRSKSNNERAHRGRGDN